jgi:hypothetical protein
MRTTTTGGAPARPSNQKPLGRDRFRRAAAAASDRSGRRPAQPCIRGRTGVVKPAPAQPRNARKVGASRRGQSVEITIRHLLNMTSGLGPGLLATEAGQQKLVTGCTEKDALAAGASEPPVAPPGTKWVYSNYRRPAGAGRGADHGPGHEHGHPAAHRQTSRLTSHPPPHHGERPERALHARVRDRRGRLHHGAGCRLG